VKPGLRGVSLVEMLIGLAIGLVISLAALALYLALDDSARASRAAVDINQIGRLALETIGRDLQQAGFYPADYPARSDPALVSTIGEYFNGKPGHRKAFDTGVYGCSSSAYDPGSQGCAASVVRAPDSIIINRYSELGTPGSATDCNGRTAVADKDNAERSTARMPLFVSNRYAIKDLGSKSGSGSGTGSTPTLACHGNGDDAATAYLPLVRGVEDLVVRYGVYSGSGSAQSPERFLDAASVDSEPLADGLSPWQRVVAVQLCVVVRSPEASRGEDAKRDDRRLFDCRGNELAAIGPDRHMRKRYERVYAVRNNLTGAL